MSHLPKPPCAGLLSFRGFTVRYVIEEDGQAWLVARDILNLLGLDMSRSPGRCLASLPEADRPLHPVETSHGFQKARMVSPAGAIALTKLRKRALDAHVRSFLVGSATILGAPDL